MREKDGLDMDKRRGFLWLRENLRALKYALYVIFHPIDGFWDLKHEGRGSMAAAHVIVCLTLLARLWIKQYSSFLFVNVNWEKVNIWNEMAQVLLPLLIWCVANWCLTTLFHGLGTLQDIYMATAYALTPYPLIQIPLCILSNLITEEEGILYGFFSGFSVVWCAALLLFGLMMIHGYTMSQTVLAVLVTLVGMVVIIVLCLLIFSMLSEAVAYFISLGREFLMRLY